MKAARFERNRVYLEDVKDPVPRPGEAVLEVAYTAFCGSDKRLLREGAACIPGHEIVGRVIELGDGAETVVVGQAAAVYILLYCGLCDWCKRGMTNRCTAMAGLVGWQVDGGFAEKLRVPVRNLLPVPPDIPIRQAVLALDTLGTAANGLNRAISAVDGCVGPVLVLGCGPLGLGVIAVARARGLEVVAHDIVASRLEAAWALGARGMEADVMAWIDAGSTDTIPGAQFSVVVEASGALVAKNIASQLVGHGGAVLMLGEGEQPWSLPASVHWRRTEATWVRSFYFPIHQARENWQLVREVGKNLEELLVSYAPFSDLSRISDEFLRGLVTKPVIVIADD